MEYDSDTKDLTNINPEVLQNIRRTLAEVIIPCKIAEEAGIDDIALAGYLGRSFMRINNIDPLNITEDQLKEMKEYQIGISGMVDEVVNQ